MNIIILNYDVITGSKYKLVEMAEIHNSHNNPNDIKISSFGLRKKRCAQQIFYASNFAKNREQRQSAALLLAKNQKQKKH